MNKRIVYYGAVAGATTALILSKMPEIKSYVSKTLKEMAFRKKVNWQNKRYRTQA